MRKVVLERFGGPEVLSVADVPDPEPSADEYVVEIKAAGLNFADVVERRGRYRKNQSLPYELGKEAAGVVVERGADARAFAVGDRVIVIRFGGGCYAERVAVDVRSLLPAPAAMTFEELAAFPIAFGTAWYAMNEIARVRAGESVLIQAAAGSVGTAAIQLARSIGARPVFGTAGGPEKVGFVEGLGADVAIDYRALDFREPVLEHTDGVGVDYVLESVGGEVLERSLQILAPMGRLVIIGFSSIREGYAEAVPRLHPLSLFHRSTSVAGLNVENLDLPARRTIWDQMVAHVARHSLRPVVGHRFGLEEVGRAHEALENRLTHGKIVLVP